MSRNVQAVQVMFRNAQRPEQSDLFVEAIAQQPARGCGRRGTILRPTIALLRAVRKFSPTGPIIVITTGQ